MSKEKQSKKDSSARVSWGPKLFLTVTGGVLLFFWWLLIYSGGVVLHH
ncbi:MAG: hypothetical protein HOM84_00175 [Thiotrichales bacterium]|jgi:hypothetical protein|nr:hypothetical protein [Thiotrichales bacterium]MBT3613651.1 hypothetical protein [Thiotrichales bacterium]MBT3753166.1 hypothetical protein [Thiotrichales bacterium]MBT3837488.1 hypothetical protein [Thiotrichales bacterium]MBT4151900.1 hypothetical protein [Thiotrichales bacterium]